jgi:hypothetical protein
MMRFKCSNLDLDRAFAEQRLPRDDERLQRIDVVGKRSRLSVNDAERISSLAVVQRLS